MATLSQFVHGVTVTFSLSMVEKLSVSITEKSKTISETSVIPFSSKEESIHDIDE